MLKVAEIILGPVGCQQIRDPCALLDSMITTLHVCEYVCKGHHPLHALRLVFSSLSCLKQAEFVLLSVDVSFHSKKLCSHAAGAANPSPDPLDQQPLSIMPTDILQ
uniref:Uncharacterized protein n=1 Tax=Octopus bimaculoides TaxID=37653 RepID=A0A0L8GQB4_OCTBM